MGLATGLLVGELGLQQAVSYDGDAFLVALVIALASMPVWLTRARILLAGGLGVLAAVWFVVAATPLTLALAPSLVRTDPLAPAEAIFVLASSVQPDGDLNASSSARLHHALELARAGLAPRLVLADIADRPASHAAAAARMLRELRLEIPIDLAGRVSNTHDEAVAAAGLFRARGWRRVILVTSPLHSRRAAAAFERAGLEVISSPASEPRFNVEALLGADDRLEAFGEILHEHLGLLIYSWRSWI